MRPDLEALVPRDKYDTRTAQAAAALGWTEMEPIASRLLEWVQDANWPVAGVLSPSLAQIGNALAPHVRAVLASDDEQWKYHLIQSVVARSTELAEALGPELQRIALHPTASEKDEEVDIVARNALGLLR